MPRDTARSGSAGNGSVVDNRGVRGACDRIAVTHDTARIAISIYNALSGAARFAVRGAVDRRGTSARDAARIISLIAALTDRARIDNGRNRARAVTRDTADQCARSGINRARVRNGGGFACNRARAVTRNAAHVRTRNSGERQRAVHRACRRIAVCRNGSAVSAAVRKIDRALGRARDTARKIQSVNRTAVRAVRNGVRRYTGDTARKANRCRRRSDIRGVRAAGNRSRRSARDAANGLFTIGRRGGNGARVRTGRNRCGAARDTRDTARIFAGARERIVRKGLIIRRSRDGCRVRAVTDRIRGEARNSAENEIAGNGAARFVLRVRDRARAVTRDTARNARSRSGNRTAVCDLNGRGARDRARCVTRDAARVSARYARNNRRRSACRDRTAARDRAADIATRVARDAADCVRAADRAGVGSGFAACADRGRSISRNAARISRARDRAAVGNVRAGRNGIRGITHDAARVLRAVNRSGVLNRAAVCDRALRIARDTARNSLRLGSGAVVTDDSVIGAAVDRTTAIAGDTAYAGNAARGGINSAVVYTIRCAGARTRDTAEFGLIIAGNRGTVSVRRTGVAA